MPTAVAGRPTVDWIQILLRNNLKTIQRVGHQTLALPAGDIFVGKRQVDVLLHGEVIEQVITLEYHADIFLGQFRALLAL